MSEDPELQPPERGYLHALRIRALILWLPLLVGAVVLDRLVLAETWGAGLVPLAVAILAAVGVIVAPRRIFRRLGWKVEGDQLQAVRGWLLHVDTIVPFVRVQHIDVSRAPLDKMFGTASLVIHTAGTHNNVVVVPGLAPERADSLRSLIRATIRSDLG
jgi:membrane protein YdbS with pleckstrin-like domain